jgi:hypothetical protein
VTAGVTDSVLKCFGNQSTRFDTQELCRMLVEDFFFEKEHLESENYVEEKQ